MVKKRLTPVVNKMDQTIGFQTPDEENVTCERWEKLLLILQSIAKGITKVPSSVDDLTCEVERRFDILETKYSAVSILAAATVVSLTIASLWGALAISNIIEKSATSFAYLAIPYILLWCSILILMLRNKTIAQKIPTSRT